MMEIDDYIKLCRPTGFFECSNGKFDDRGKKYALRDAVIRLEQTAGFVFNATF